MWKHNSPFYKKKRKEHTALWPRLILISSPSTKQVFGLNPWKENYLSEMFKTSTFRPIVVEKKAVVSPFISPLKQGDHFPLGEQWESTRCSRLKAFSSYPLNLLIGPAELPMKLWLESGVKKGLGQKVNQQRFLKSL